MIVAFLSDQDTLDHLYTHPVMRESGMWLQQNARDADLGTVSLGSPDWYVNVHEYTTRPESDCVWESHERTVDLQYIIDGEETIRWAPTWYLGRTTARAQDADRLEWTRPDTYAGSLHMVSGMAALFLAGEAHCPMIAVEKPILIRKAVVKIPSSLLQRDDP